MNRSRGGFEKETLAVRKTRKHLPTGDTLPTWETGKETAGMIQSRRESAQGAKQAQGRGSGSSFPK